MEPLNIKICGMKHNTEEIAGLQPDFLGFIFYPSSPRYFESTIPKLPSEIKKVGVFVNAEIDDILKKITTHKLDIIQLHGNESPKYCERLLRAMATTLPTGKGLPPLWKVFGVDRSFSFDPLYAYEDLVDAYLFDTKSELYGGTGKKFNWKLLKKYPFNKPFIVSGGIGMEEVQAIRELRNLDLPLIAVDVNSKFETQPGNKDAQLLQLFMQNLRPYNRKPSKQPIKSTKP